MAEHYIYYNRKKLTNVKKKIHFLSYSEMCPNPYQQERNNELDERREKNSQNENLNNRPNTTAATTNIYAVYSFTFESQSFSDEYNTGIALNKYKYKYTNVFFLLCLTSHISYQRSSSWYRGIVYSTYGGSIYGANAICDRLIHTIQFSIRLERCWWLWA